MSVLTKQIIFQKIHNGEIKIEPFKEELVGPASIDLHLGNKFRVFKKFDKNYTISSDTDLSEVTELITKDRYILSSGQMVHGITLENITLPENICGRIEGKSSIGRLGIAVHITAGFMQPGVSNKQVLEMYNVGPIKVVLNAGMLICQIILEETQGKAKYTGKFSSQNTP